MAKKQTRRSVSLSKDTYNLLKERCDKEGVTMSGIVSQLIEDYLAGNLQPSSMDIEDVEEEETVEAQEEVEDEDQPVPTRFVVNTDLIVVGPTNETEAEQMVGAIVQRLIKKNEIAEALVLSADPE